MITADGYVIESEPAKKRAGSKGNVRTSNTSSAKRGPGQPIAPRALTTMF